MKEGYEVTIKDIAKLSGCGVATVSRVLNDHPDVSDETRRKVLAVVEEQGFQPNNNAKHLKQQSSTSIAIIVKGIMNMLFADLVEKVQALLRDAGQDAAVYYLDEDANEVAYACQLCRERRPMGILFLGGDLELFEAGFASVAVPCVLLTNTAQELGFPNLSSFTTDDHLAAQQVVELLAAKGHTHIGLLGATGPVPRSATAASVAAGTPVSAWDCPSTWTGSANPAATPCRRPTPPPRCCWSGAPTLRPSSPSAT